MMHRLGFAVKVLADGGLPSHDTRRWQSGPHLSVSLDRLDAILDRLDALDIRMYRMASALAPYVMIAGRREASSPGAATP
jgi:UV DNA damage endonuclease